MPSTSSEAAEQLSVFLCRLSALESARDLLAHHGTIENALNEKQTALDRVTADLAAAKANLATGLADVEKAKATGEGIINKGHADADAAVAAANSNADQIGERSEAGRRN